MRAYINNIFGRLVPKYHELTTFLTALTCLVLFLAYPDFRQIYFSILAGGNSPYWEAAAALLALGLIVTMGFIFSFYHIVTKSRKTMAQMLSMGAFTLAANGMAGIYAGSEVFPSHFSVRMIFPLFNILMGVLQLYQIGLVRFEVTDENASFLEVFFASLLFGGLFILSYYQLHLSWAMTFSVCMFYSSTVVYFFKWLTKRGS
jgi:hypothetical protein